MKFVFASDSFKGTLSSKRISQLLTIAAREVLGDCECIPVTIADGGEGTLDALMSAGNGMLIPVVVHDPLMNEIKANYGVFDAHMAVVEMAQASGLTLVDDDKRNPLYTSSIGTGELIRVALRAGHTDLTVAIGGSATNDGGMGAMTALGVRFLDKNGKPLEGLGINLGKVHSVNMSGMPAGLDRAVVSVMCDVKNPLCGVNGATYVYGPQKGADDEILKVLEDGMENYRRVLTREFGIDPNDIQGAGAAGGMGAALKLFLGAELKSGIESVLDIVRFDSLISDVDYVITGEGRLDGQSSIGKAVQGIGDRAKKAGVPCIALCGCLGEGYEEIMDHGITRIVTLADDNITAEYAIEQAEEVYYKKALELFRTLRRGIKEMTKKEQEVV